MHIVSLWNTDLQAWLPGQRTSKLHHSSGDFVAHTGSSLLMMVVGTCSGSAVMSVRSVSMVSMRMTLRFRLCRLRARDWVGRSGCSCSFSGFAASQARHKARLGGGAGSTASHIVDILGLI